MLVLQDGTRKIAAIRLQPGVGPRGIMTLEDDTFDNPAFLVSCALIFRDWISRA